MRTFKNGNWSNPKDECPVCETNKPGEVVLVPKQGTEDGNNIQDVQVHTKCIGERMVYVEDQNVIVIDCVNYKS